MNKTPRSNVSSPYLNLRTPKRERRSMISVISLSNNKTQTMRKEDPPMIQNTSNTRNFSQQQTNGSSENMLHRGRSPIHLTSQKKFPSHHPSQTRSSQRKKEAHQKFLPTSFLMNFQHHLKSSIRRMRTILAHDNLFITRKKTPRE